MEARTYQLAHSVSLGKKYTNGSTHSISRLWMRISYLSQVLEPSPQGDLRVTMWRVLVGRRTGPLTVSDLERARSISSWHTFSREATLREVRVIRILWIFWKRADVRSYHQRLGSACMHGNMLMPDMCAEIIDIQGLRRNPSRASGKTS